MRYLSSLILAIGMLVGMTSLGLGDNYLKNADFKEGSQLWRGDGQAAFLKPDGTEGSETDPGVVPVIRLTLSKGQARSVYQEFHLQDAPGKLRIKVQVYASVDFKRSTHASDYQAEYPMPNTDFLVRLLPEYYERTSNLKPGQWVTVQSMWESPAAADDRAIYFMVPPGEGVVYIKNPSVTP